MKTDKAMTEKKKALEATLKTAFDAKVAEPAPDHLVDLAHKLDAATRHPREAKAS